MYTITTKTGAINFPDGFVLLPPYEHPRYQEYAAWIHAGNSPEEVVSNTLEGAVNTIVKPDKARIAMARLNVYATVQALLSSENTPIEIQLKFEYTDSFARNDPAVLLMAGILGWNGEFLDELFALAESII